MLGKAARSPAYLRYPRDRERSQAPAGPRQRKRLWTRDTSEGNLESAVKVAANGVRPAEKMPACHQRYLSSWRN
jgi:hypothetical protein